MLWAVFGAAVVVMLALDLGVFHRKAHAVGTREAVTWSIVWVALALLFAGLVLVERGVTPAVQFVTAYVVEKSLSVDNIFVFLLIFTYFGVPREYQHRVLFWGVLSAVVMRAVFIGAGVAAVQRFHWLMYPLGAILLYTGVKLALGKGREVRPAENPVVRLCVRLFRVTPDDAGGRFFVVRNGKLFATPLLIVLAAVEATDLVFAVDSVPAVLAITLDPMIAYTSNVFAILGLRALYFALAGVLPRFRYLHPALALILVLVGLKMLLAELYRPPTGVTLGAVVAILGGAIALQVVRPSTASGAVDAGTERGVRG